MICIIPNSSCSWYQQQSVHSLTFPLWQKVDLVHQHVQLSEHIAPFTWHSLNATEEWFVIVTSPSSLYCSSGLILILIILILPTLISMSIFAWYFGHYFKPRLKFLANHRRFEHLCTSAMVLGVRCYFCKQILSIVYSVPPYRSHFLNIFLLVIWSWDPSFEYIYNDGEGMINVYHYAHCRHIDSGWANELLSLIIVLFSFSLPPYFWQS